MAQGFVTGAWDHCMGGMGHQLSAYTVSQPLASLSAIAIVIHNKNWK